MRGRLRPEVGLRALLRATFPGGSITGAPKLRAMEIIDELEPSPRGPYTGATGWLGAAGDLDLAIAIRTALVRDGRLTLSVGGGIVADSTPTTSSRDRGQGAGVRGVCGGDSARRRRAANTTKPDSSTLASWPSENRIGSPGGRCSHSARRGVSSWAMKRRATSRQISTTKRSAA